MMVCLTIKDRLKPNPIAFQSGELSVGPDVVNDSPFRALSYWYATGMVAKLKKKDRQNLTLMTLNQLVPI